MFPDIFMQPINISYCLFMGIITFHHHHHCLWSRRESQCIISPSSSVQCCCEVGKRSDFHSSVSELTVLSLANLLSIVSIVKIHNEVLVCFFSHPLCWALNLALSTQTLFFSKLGIFLMLLLTFSPPIFPALSPNPATNTIGLSSTPKPPVGRGSVGTKFNFNLFPFQRNVFKR